MSKKIVGKGATNEAPGQQHRDQHHVVSSEGAQVVNPGPGDTVTLPEGTTIVSLEADGRDLIIVLSDGEKILIPDGAVVVPQIVVDNTAVPPANIAALLIDNEVQPAAGPAQSSGGNFAADEGAIQSAYGLGNLLPYTELHFELQPRHELFPAVVNKEPSVVVETPDNPAGAIDAVATVYEAGLPARNGEPAGTGEAADGDLTNDSDPRETTNGTIVVNSPDGIQAVLVNGTAIDHVGQIFTSADGTLKITSIDLAAGRIGFSYTLADNLLGQTSDGPFQVTVVDSDGDQATATLHINVVDDAPIAAADTDTVAAGTYGPESGNVISGEGTTSGAEGADRVGADAASVSAVSHGDQSVTADDGGTMVIAGDYGTLTIHDDGSYTYVRDAGTSGGVDDRFTYTLTDGDGSTDTATLTIHIDDSPAVVTSVPETGDGTIVDETGLPPHDGGPVGIGEDSDGIPDNNSDTSETTHGTITFAAPDGPASVEINGTAITGASQVITIPEGTLTITAFDPAAGTLDYSFTLTNNTSGDDTSVTFTVTVTDVDGDSDSAPFTIHIVDDTPLALPDADSVTEDGPLTADGNVLTGSGGSDANTTDGVTDSQGADGAHVTAVAFGATAGTVGTGLAGDYGTLTLNSDGSYSYALDNTNALVQGLDKSEHLTETFTYTITDGDGDPSTTTLTITINGADDGVTIGGLNANGAEQTVYEANLADGSAPDAAALTQSGTFTVTAQDGLATISVGGHTVYTGDAFVPGQTVSTAYGTLTITGVTSTTTDANGDVTAATVSYSYELTDNTLAHTGANDVSLTDSFDITVTDTDGSTANDHLEVTVVDDTPLAFDNSNTVDEGGSVGGNVLSDGTPDVFGADGKGGVATFTDGVHTAAPGGTIETALGFLTINADGSYDYESKPNSTSVDTHDTFTYTIVDADGDTSPATLTIDITATAGNVSDNDVSVDESGLDNGTYTGSQLVPNGEFDTNGQISATGGTPPYSYVLTSPADGTYGTLALNGSTGAYSYTLDTPFTDAVNENSRNVVNGAESFTYDVYDNLGNFIGSGSISVNITDDVPTAVDDALQTLAEDAAGTIGGNVMANDTQGADGASVTSVNIGGVDHAIAAVGTTTVDTANGHYTFQADGTWTFDPNTGLDQSGGPIDASFTYTLTDGDGDHDTATQPISITDGAGPTGGDTLSLTVDDGALADGNNSASGAEVDAGQLTFTAGSDA
ncbi:MAG TPA: Ig-like domain-containing protein, partial [Croceibacterium sp.]|nr:Ig-like domain-containing protein [Croceibacterium sp.]